MLTADEERSVVATILNYGTAIDQRNWDLLASCFTADVQTDYGPVGTWPDRRALVEHMRKFHETIGPTLHRMTNIVVARSMQGASATTYVDALLMGVGSFSQGRQAAGIYHDELMLSDGHWRINRRRYTLVFARSL